MNRVYTGTVEGTGAAISVTTGFVPKYVRLFNVDGGCWLEWSEEMGAGKGMKIADSGTAKCDISYISSGCVTIKGSAATDTILGFSIGTDSDINANGETICWVAFADRQ